MRLKIISSFVLTVLIASGFSQIQVSHVTSNTDLGNKQGMFYALPNTVIQVKIDVIKTEYLAGPYAQYASKYLDLENVITDDYDHYEIVGAKLSSMASPDPNNIYFAVFDEKAIKENVSVLMSLSEEGLAMGMGGKKDKKNTGIQINPEDESYFQYFAAPNLVEVTDTTITMVVVDTAVVEKIYLDKRWVEKSDEQKAVEAANKIEKLRKDKLNLLTGYQEIAYDAGTIRYMHEELSKMENEYLSLFTGISMKKKLTYTFHVIPEKEGVEMLVPVFVFSSTSGVKKLGSSGGEKINLHIENLSNLSDAETVINNHNSANGSARGFYYRIPSSAVVTLDINRDVKTQAVFPISQFGYISYLPPYVTSVQFHKNTGAIKKIQVD
jgi:hypothetical protein